MATKVMIPRMGLTMVDGEVSRWLLAEGDRAEKGQGLFELQTDKVNVEIEAERNGVLRKILVEAGERVPVGTVVAIIGDEDEDISGLLSSDPGRCDSDESPERKSSRIIASPAAKRLAREYGLDLSSVRGSGPGGRISEQDVRDAAVGQATGTDDGSRAGATSPAATPAAVDASPGAPRVSRLIPVEGRRKAISERMAKSARTCAPVTLSRDVDFTRLVELAASLKGIRQSADGATFTLTDLIALTTVRALGLHPELNASLSADGIAVFEDVNLGIAVDTPQGLIVPVIRGAHRMGLADLARERGRLVSAARSGRIRPEDIEGGTFTVSNLGQFGIDSFSPIINYPETAILGIGRVTPRPWVVEEALAVRQIGWVSLSFDHRVVDGAPAARFLGEIADLIENPGLLLVRDRI